MKSRRPSRYLLLPLIAVPLATLFLVGGRTQAAGTSVSPALTSEIPAPAGAGPVADVWQVEKSGDLETYSNGLRLEIIGSPSATTLAANAFFLPIPRIRVAGLVA